MDISAPAIRGVAIGAQEQRNVVMLLRIRYFKGHNYLWIKNLYAAGREIDAGLKRQAVGAGFESALGKKIFQAAVGVRRSLGFFLPLAGSDLALEKHGNIHRGFPERSVQDVRGDSAHEFSNFSKRRRVILRCSSAAIGNSASGVLEIRSRRDCNISSLVFPVAQIRKTCSNFFA